MIVYQAHRLHERIDRRGPDEGPAPPLQIPGEGSGPGCQGDVARWRGLVRVGPPPEVAGQRALLLDHLEGPGRVVDGGPDLPLVTDDPGIGEEAGDVVIPEPGDLHRVEPGEPGPKGLPLAEDGDPREARLKALEADLLEQPVVVGDRATPLRVVIADVEVVGPDPGRSEEHTSELQSRPHLVCRLLLEKKKK